MNNRELNSLSRRDLVELMVEMKKEEALLKEQIADLQCQLDNRNIKIRKAGSLAEAMLSVNGVMEAAQEAANQYLAEIQRAHGNIEKSCSEMLLKTNEECKRREEETNLRISVKWKEFDEKVSQYIKTHSDLEKIMNVGK